MKLFYSAATGLFFLLSLETSMAAATKVGEPAQHQPQIGIDTHFGDRFHEAQKAFHEDKYADTVAKVTAAMAMQPDDKNAVFLLTWRGWAYMKLRDNGRALADFNEAIRRNPTVKHAYANRAFLNYETGNYAQATADFTRALAEERPIPWLYSARANSYMKLGQPELARPDYEKVALAPAKDADDYRRRAEAFRRVGQYERAGLDFVAAKRMQPTDQSILNDAAWFEATSPSAKSRDGKAAVRDATHACERSKWKDPDIVDTLAAAYAESGDFARAIGYEKQAIGLQSAKSDRKILQEHLAGFQQGKPVREDLAIKR